LIDASWQRYLDLLNSEASDSQLMSALEEHHKLCSQAISDSFADPYVPEKMSGDIQTVKSSRSLSSQLGNINQKHEITEITKSNLGILNIDDERDYLLNWLDHTRKVLQIQYSTSDSSTLQEKTENFGTRIVNAVTSFFFSISGIFKSSGYNDYYQQGIKLKKQSQYFEAIEEFKKALEFKPNDLLVKTMIIECLIWSSDFIKARTALSQIPVAPHNFSSADCNDKNYNIKFSGQDNSWPSFTPDDSNAWLVPVLLIKYFPCLNGKIDQNITKMVINKDLTLENARSRTTRISLGVINALEEGSCYKKYKNPESQPSLKFIIVDCIEHREALPLAPCPYYVGKDPDNWCDRPNIVDYNKLLLRDKIENYVKSKGVKEVWLWGYHNEDIVIWESNMSSPSGDVSNSNCGDDWGKNDMPVFDRTYTLYTFNLDREVSEALEAHTHQLERILTHVNRELFWNRYVGYFPNDERNDMVSKGKLSSSRRCGWAHYPPNGDRDYDWSNTQTVISDIQDWDPDGGKFKEISSDLWGMNSLEWFVYWRQNIPGRNNGIHWDEKDTDLTNWWYCVADWDSVMKNKFQLSQ
jgi:tetratricopeptide (TPR) repeat protein